MYKMKKIGIIAGIGPESTIEYYRSIIKIFKEKTITNDYPEIILNSINFTKMFNFVLSDDFDGLVIFMKDQIDILENAGAKYVVLASNTPHIVFDRLVKTAKVPMISIVEETCRVIASKGIKKVALFGTKSTMSKGFYQHVASKYDIEIVIPNNDLQNYIHNKYMNELLIKKILPETKQKLIEITEDLKVEMNIEGLILGGTELPFILSQNDFSNIEIFDTTEIHVNSIVNKMLEQ